LRGFLDAVDGKNDAEAGDEGEQEDVPEAAHADFRVARRRRLLLTRPRRKRGADIQRGLG
jgi:hypothetical protein